MSVRQRTVPRLGIKKGGSYFCSDNDFTLDLPH